jgi:hypothetical protein
MRVVTVSSVASETTELGLLGTQTQVFRGVPSTTTQICALKIQNSVYSSGDCELLRLGLRDSGDPQINRRFTLQVDQTWGAAQICPPPVGLQPTDPSVNR